MYFLDYFTSVDLFTSDNIIIFLAVTGFLLAVLAHIFRFKENRFRVNLIYKSHFVNRETEVGGVDFFFTIENKSKLPVSVSCMFLKIDGQEHEFFSFRKRVHGASTDETYPEMRSIALPVKIEGYGAVGGYFSVRVGKPTSDSILYKSKVKIILLSNRGKKSVRIYPDVQSTFEITKGLDIDLHHN